MTSEKKQKEFQKLKKEKDEYLEGWQKERANFINYKKDEKERFKEVIRFPMKELVKYFNCYSRWI